MSPEEFSIRRATHDDLPAVLFLLGEHLGPGAGVDAHHRWLYRQNPHGEALTWIAHERASREPAGITSLFPRRVSVHGTEHLGAIGGDGYVRPSFRCRGIATALHSAALRGMREEGVELEYGPPEPKNLRALERAGARVVCQLRRFVRPLGTRRLQPWLGPIAWPLDRVVAPSRSPLRLVRVHGADPRVQDLWERAAEDLPIAPVRDPAFYGWRFGRDAQYIVEDGGRAVAVCALQHRAGRTAILDLLAPRSRWSAAVAAILHARRDDDAVEFRLNERGPLASSLWRFGFVPRDRKAFQVMVAGRRLRSALLRRASDWYYTSGDGDVTDVL